jgi:hypothetical protein
MRLAMAWQAFGLLPKTSAIIEKPTLLRTRCESIIWSSSDHGSSPRLKNALHSRSRQTSPRLILRRKFLIDNTERPNRKASTCGVTSGFSITKVSSDLV